MKRKNIRHFFRLMIIMLLIITITGCGKTGSVPVQLDDGNTASDQNPVYAIISIKDYGKMKFRLLDKYAPSAVSLFTDMAEKGYFDNKSIYMAIRDFGFIAGSASETEFNGQSLIVENDQTDTKTPCYPLKGALCFTEALGGGRYSAANFAVIHAGKDFIEELEELLKYKKVTLAEYFKQAYGNEIKEEDLKVFRKYGGAPWIYGHCIVFGQLIEGEEVLDSICCTEVSDDSGFVPMEDIIIESVTIEK